MPQKSRRASSHATRDAERRRHQRRDDGDPQRKQDRRPFCRREFEHALGRRADQEREAVFLEDGLGRRRAQEGEIAGGFRLRSRRRRDRIDDRRDANPPGRCRRSSRRVRPWRRSHRRCRARLRRAPPAPAPRARFRPSRISARPHVHAPSFSSAALAYLPTGTDLTSPVAILPSPASLARSKPWSDRHVVDLGILRRDQHDLVAEQVDPRRLVDGLLADRVIHPVGIGGDENVRRRALFDLLGERGARGIARDDLDAGFRGIGGVDVVERVLHRGGGEHREALSCAQRGRMAIRRWPETGSDQKRRAAKIPAVRCIGRSMRDRSRRNARKQVVGLWMESRSGGSAVPAIPRLTASSGYRSRNHSRLGIVHARKAIYG